MLLSVQRPDQAGSACYPPNHWQQTVNNLSNYPEGWWKFLQLVCVHNKKTIKLWFRRRMVHVPSSDFNIYKYTPHSLKHISVPTSTCPQHSGNFKFHTVTLQIKCLKVSRIKSLPSPENEWLNGHTLTEILLLHKLRTVRNYSCNGHFVTECAVIWTVYYSWNNLNWHPHFKIIPANTINRSVLFNHAINCKEHTELMVGEQNINI